MGSSNENYAFRAGVAKSGCSEIAYRRIERRIGRGGGAGDGRGVDSLRIQGIDRAAGVILRAWWALNTKIGG